MWLTFSRPDNDKEKRCAVVGMARSGISIGDVQSTECSTCGNLITLKLFGEQFKIKSQFL
jgi:hypothetical protein